MVQKKTDHIMQSQEDAASLPVLVPELQSEQPQDRFSLSKRLLGMKRSTENMSIPRVSVKFEVMWGRSRSHSLFILAEVSRKESSLEYSVLRVTFESAPGRQSCRGVSASRFRYQATGIDWKTLTKLAFTATTMLSLTSCGPQKVESIACAR